MPKLLIAAVIVVGWLTLDRILRMMESRGWIYYRKSSGHGASTLGPALEELHGVFDPGAKAAVEYLIEEQVEVNEAGDPIRPWSPVTEDSGDAPRSAAPQEPGSGPSTAAPEARQ